MGPDKAAAIAKLIPPGSWDSHIHIIDPATHPLSPTALYTPPASLPDAALAHAASLNLSHLVVVQPSIYGADNACLLAALPRLGPRARGVVALDPSPAAAALPAPPVLRAWHAAGVRGVRLNLRSVRPGAVAIDAAALRALAAAARPLRWALQLYVPLAAAPLVERELPALGGVRLVFDHLGAPPDERQRQHAAAGEEGPDPYALDGFAALARMLRRPDVYVKLSAPYRAGGRTGALERELIRLAGDRGVVFATDWPHTRFEGIDIAPWVEGVVRMCEEEGGRRLVERVFRDNAEELWGWE